MTPSQLVAHFRENQNNNKTLKSLFASQFLGKFSAEELEGIGHWTQQEAPEEVNSALLRFLEEVS